MEVSPDTITDYTVPWRPQIGILVVCQSLSVWWDYCWTPFKSLDLAFRKHAALINRQLINSGGEFVEKLLMFNESFVSGFYDVVY